MLPLRLVAPMLSIGVGIGATGCRVANVDEAKASRERERARSPLTEDRAGTRVLKTILSPVAMLFSGGVPAEDDSSRVRSRLTDRWALGGSDVERELFRERYEREIEAFLESLRTTPTRAGEKDR